VNSRFGRLGERHGLRGIITGSGEIAQTHREPRPDTEPQAQAAIAAAQASIQSHHEIGAWLGAGEERSHELEHEAFHRLRTIAAAPATAAA
jgi:hypothetical protein